MRGPAGAPQLRRRGRGRACLRAGEPGRLLQLRAVPPAAQPSLAAGAAEQLSATGTTPTGDNLTALQVPIADPASHLWSSSNPQVAAVDPDTGQLTARSPGTATISVLSGGVTGSVTITVTPAT
jgi:hypothetical protein